MTTLTQLVAELEDAAEAAGQAGQQEAEAKLMFDEAKAAHDKATGHMESLKRTLRDGIEGILGTGRVRQ